MPAQLPSGQSWTPCLPDVPKRLPALPFPEVTLASTRRNTFCSRDRGGARSSEEFTLFKGRSHRRGPGSQGILRGGIWSVRCLLGPFSVSSALSPREVLQKSGGLQPPLRFMRRVCAVCGFLLVPVSVLCLCGPSLCFRALLVGSPCLVFVRALLRVSVHSVSCMP